MVSSICKKFIIESLILKDVKKQLVITSQGWRIARIIFELGKIIFINPSSIIDNGNLSIIIFVFKKFVSKV